MTKTPITLDISNLNKNALDVPKYVYSRNNSTPIYKQIPVSDLYLDVYYSLANIERNAVNSQYYLTSINNGIV